MKCTIDCEFIVKDCMQKDCIIVHLWWYAADLNWACIWKYLYCMFFQRLLWEKRKHILLHWGCSWGSSDASIEAEHEKTQRDTVFWWSKHKYTTRLFTSKSSRSPLKNNFTNSREAFGCLLGMNSHTTGYPAVQSLSVQVLYLLFQTQLLIVLG